MTVFRFAGLGPRDLARGVSTTAEYGIKKYDNSSYLDGDSVHRQSI